VTDLVAQRFDAGVRNGKELTKDKIAVVHTSTTRPVGNCRRASRCWWAGCALRLPGPRRSSASAGTQDRSLAAGADVYSYRRVSWQPGVRGRGHQLLTAGCVEVCTLGAGDVCARRSTPGRPVQCAWPRSHPAATVGGGAAGSFLR
jgi:hypothetical protein